MVQSKSLTIPIYQAPMGGLKYNHDHVSTDSFSSGSMGKCLIKLRILILIFIGGRRSLKGVTRNISNFENL